jgi:pimeloyl-ACP methyl ester carboxylesterase
MSIPETPLALATFGHLFVGGRIDHDIEGGPTVGQMYVEYFIPHEVRQPWPIVMVHGGSQTGTNFTGTPDGREGWAQFFVRRGYAVYVVDQVARGRAAHWSQAHGATDTSRRVNVKLIESRFTAPAHYDLWPQAKLHTQFPGTGRAPDEDFTRFYATQFPGIVDLTRQQHLNRDALVALLEKIGPSILVTHSQSGPFGWLVGDARPDLVKAVVALEPHGPPVHNITDGHPRPDWYRDVDHLKPYGLTDAPLTYDPPVTTETPLRVVQQTEPDGPDMVRCWCQADPPRRLPRLAGIPIAIFVAEASYHAAYDHCTSAWLTQAGVPHTFTRLADIGIRGNGHMMMVEKNSDAIADAVARWCEETLANQT